MSLSKRDILDVMSLILLFGTLISVALVMIGGTIHLWQHGMENIRIELLNINLDYNSLSAIWQAATALTPLGIVAFGVLILILTQIIRVLFLVFYYYSIADYWFFAISSFIFIVLAFSFFGEHLLRHK